MRAASLKSTQKNLGRQGQAVSPRKMSAPFSWPLSQYKGSLCRSAQLPQSLPGSDSRGCESDSYGSFLIYSYIFRLISYSVSCVVYLLRTGSQAGLWLHCKSLAQHGETLQSPSSTVRTAQEQRANVCVLLRDALYQEVILSAFDRWQNEMMETKSKLKEIEKKSIYKFNIKEADCVTVCSTLTLRGLCSGIYL